ncbi:hypothetical protein CNYM01_08478 [Colletotrichum nymphaeae SA-01]|uniref:Uncharacterized protein n=1 Tax=Colletotrichum nymphaeae SA-01 TaxID=1460502 RepID=A0A135TEA7_9PEZI|nr:hypothetical protein CNYM01_08478 [Colletotrichum nymphaeae SA-01]
MHYFKFLTLFAAMAAAAPTPVTGGIDEVVVKRDRHPEGVSGKISARQCLAETDSLEPDTCYNWIKRDEASVA